MTHSDDSLPSSIFPGQMHPQPVWVGWACVRIHLRLSCIMTPGLFVKCLRWDILRCVHVQGPLSFDLDPGVLMRSHGRDDIATAMIQSERCSDLAQVLCKFRARAKERRIYWSVFFSLRRPFSPSYFARPLPSSPVRTCRFVFFLSFRI